MSTFDALESSATGSRPLEIYRFVFGLTEFLYTSSASDQVVNGDTYTSIPIRRGRISVGQAERKRVLEINVPSTNAFVANYIGIPPGQKATVEITRLQRDESPSFNTQVKIFEGSIQTVKFPGGALASIAAQTLEGVVGRTIPRRSYMGMCNHTLYGPGCGVDSNTYKFSGVVSSVSGNVVTVTGAGSSGFDFTGGFIKVTGSTDARLILSQSGDDLTLMIPFLTNVASSTMDVFAGCDHLLGGDCALVFDNVINYGGYPFVPNRNVFTNGVI